MQRPPRRGLCDPWHGRWIALATLSPLSGCFDGAAALHLPCERDEDCGRGQSCTPVAGAATRFCDGPPETFGGSQGEASTGDTGSGSSASTMGSGSSDGGPIAVCGNGVLEDGEACDEGPDSPTCNSGSDCTKGVCCTPTACGDGYVNPAYEMCEEGDDDCVDCLKVLLAPSHDDDWSIHFELGPEPVEAPVIEEMLWDYDTAQNLLKTGSYPDATEGGLVYAATEVLDLGAPLPPGVQYQLRIDHRFEFDGTACLPTPTATDGAHVEATVESTGTAVNIEPEDGYGGLITANTDPRNTCNELSDDAALPGFVQGDGEFRESVFVLGEGLAGERVRLTFQARFDCGNCWGSAPIGAGWAIRELEVAAVRVP